VLFRRPINLRYKDIKATERHKGFEKGLPVKATPFLQQLLFLELFSTYFYGFGIYSYNATVVVG
jgi:hypothetical protein